jgi:hypothetical protein
MKTDDQVTGWTRGRSSSPASGEIFLFSTASRPVVGPTQPPIQWVPEGTFVGVKRPGRQADLQLVPRSRIHGSVHPLPHTYSWRSVSLVKYRDKFTSASTIEPSLASGQFSL